jgi:hypothetical protein
LGGYGLGVSRLDWKGRKRRVREQGAERVGSDGLPRRPRFGNLRDALALPRGKEKNRFRPHVAAHLPQPAALLRCAEVAWLKNAGDFPAGRRELDAVRATCGSDPAVAYEVSELEAAGL